MALVDVGSSIAGTSTAQLADELRAVGLLIQQKVRFACYPFLFFYVCFIF